MSEYGKRSQIQLSQILWIILLFMLFLFVINCYLIIYTYLLNKSINNLKRQILLLRVINQGRTIKEVLYWMGKPDNVFKNIKIGERKAFLVLVYKSSSNYSKLNFTTDIWIIINNKGYVECVYYPDLYKDREIIFKGDIILKYIKEISFISKQ